MYSIFLRAMMYATPVLVPEEILGGILNGLLLKLNPLYYLIKMFRMVVVEGVFPPSQILWIGFFISIFTLCIGWLLFTKRMDRFAYYA